MNQLQKIGLTFEQLLLYFSDKFAVECENGRQEGIRGAALRVNFRLLYLMLLVVVRIKKVYSPSRKGT